jgi:hypothetical protein
MVSSSLGNCRAFDNELRTPNNQRQEVRRVLGGKFVRFSFTKLFLTNFDNFAHGLFGNALSLRDLLLRVAGKPELEVGRVLSGNFISLVLQYRTYKIIAIRKKSGNCPNRFAERLCS